MAQYARQPVRSILDIGCGTGNVAKTLEAMADRTRSLLHLTRTWHSHGEPDATEESRYRLMMPPEIEGWLHWAGFSLMPWPTTPTSRPATSVDNACGSLPAATLHPERVARLERGRRVICEWCLRFAGPVRLTAMTPDQRRDRSGSAPMRLFAAAGVDHRARLSPGRGPWPRCP
jgi:hypothetical protein